MYSKQVTSKGSPNAAHTVTANASSASTGMSILGSGGTCYNQTLSGTLVVTPTPGSTNRFPPDWKVIPTKVNLYEGNHEVGESPVTGKTIHVGSLAINTSIGRFHYDLFRRIYPDAECFTIGLSEGDTSVTTACNVGFHLRETWELFESWIAARVELFGSRERLYSYRFPPPPKRLGASVWIESTENTRDAMGVAAWLEQNCVGPIYMIGDFWVFTDEDDAVMFTLKYSGSPPASLTNGPSVI